MAALKNNGEFDNKTIVKQMVMYANNPFIYLAFSKMK